MRPTAAVSSGWMCVALALTTAALLALVPAAHADLFGPIELVSKSAPAEGAPQQAEEARFPVISANGEYVAFVGRYGGSSGVWRRDLRDGQVQQVAPGDATLPSISGDGRFVSFTTTERLLPEEDANVAPDVYVRDMEPGAGEPEYSLVSAVNGGGEAPTYTLGPEQHGEQEYGSLASARSAMSEDGRFVVFVTTAQSNLLGGSEPTPAMEVLVRDLATDETRLVSAEYEPGSGWSANRPVQPQAGSGGGSEQFGAVFPGGTTLPRFGELAPETEVNDHQARWLGASISADGSTVAWMGQDLARQVQLLPREQAHEESTLAEPLWRRIQEPGAPIRRVTGGSDQENPLCAASGEQELVSNTLADPCAGPFEHFRELPEGLWGKVKAESVPQLSADGRVVAFMTGARELASGEVQFKGAETTDDLYVVDMAGGLTRVQALRRLTAIGGGAPGSQEFIEKSEAIIDFAVAPAGNQVAFVTQRSAFPLSTPAYVSAPAAAPGMLELFDVDLEDETLTRVTHGFGGEDERSEELPTREQPGTDPYHAGEGAYAPSFDGDGNTLSFASTANNLVFGDGNDRPDAFVVHRIVPPHAVVQQTISSPPANPTPEAPWRISVQPVSLRNGSVSLYVETPGAGALSAAATSSLLVRAHGAGARGAKRAPRLVSRGVSSARASVLAQDEGLTSLTLTLGKAYRSLATQPGGLSARVDVTFAAAGHPNLHASVLVTFASKLAHGHADAAKSRRHSKRRGRR